MTAQAIASYEHRKDVRRLWELAHTLHADEEIQCPICSDWFQSDDGELFNSVMCRPSDHSLRILISTYMGWPY